MNNSFSDIICIADMNITGTLDRCLEDLALPEVFVQRSKQMSLTDSRGLFGLRSRTRLDESRSFIYRFYIPSVFAEGVMSRIAAAVDLKMGGRGSISSQHIGLRRGTSLSFDIDRLERLCGKTEENPAEEHALICCTIPRGSGDSLAGAALELGICVPVVFFGFGVGVRDKLGLLRITIPVDKEIIWFILPRSDAELLEKTLIPRARLDVPGQGFLYKYYLRTPVVNLKVRQGKRMHAASMEQVIAALDEVRGSSEWRRHSSLHHESSDTVDNTAQYRGLFFIGNEEETDIFRKTAMDNGARGATLAEAEMRSCSGGTEKITSRSRLLCDTLISPSDEERIINALADTGLFDKGRSCLLKIVNLEKPAAVYS